MPRFRVTGSHPVLVGDTYRQPDEEFDAEPGEIIAWHAVVSVSEARAIALPALSESVGLPESITKPSAKPTRGSEHKE